MKMTIMTNDDYRDYDILISGWPASGCGQQCKTRSGCTSAWRQSPGPPDAALELYPPLHAAAELSMTGNTTVATPAPNAAVEPPPPPNTVAELPQRGARKSALAAVPGRATRMSSVVEGSSYRCARQVSRERVSGPIGYEAVRYRAVCTGEKTYRTQDAMTSF